MSITFKRTHLITVANAALREHEKVMKDYERKVAAFRATHEEKYVLSSRQRAEQLRTLITKALRKSGRPIYARDLIPALGGSDYLSRHFYVPLRDSEIRNHVPVPEGGLRPAEVAETKALIQVLQAATGDTISVNELKLLGLKNLQPVFIAAGRS